MHPHPNHAHPTISPPSGVRRGPGHDPRMCAPSHGGAGPHRWVGLSTACYPAVPPSRPTAATLVLKAPSCVLFAATCTAHRAVAPPIRPVPVLPPPGPAPGLRIQRMPAEEGAKFGDPLAYPYMTVSRGWVSSLRRHIGSAPVAKARSCSTVGKHALHPIRRLILQYLPSPLLPSPGGLPLFP